MADRTILLAQNKRHATRGLSVVNPQEFLAYQEDDDNLTYIVDMGAYLDGATIVLVTRTPTGVVISNASNTTTRLTQRLAGYGHVDFRVQTSAGDTEQFRVYIQPRAANPAFFLTAGSGGGTTALDGDKGDVIVSSAGSTWTLDPASVASLNVFTDTLKGITPASGGGTTNFLRADGTWATPPGGGGGGGPVSDADYGDITVSSTGTVWTIDNNAVTLAKMADMATGSLIYRKTAGTGDPEVQTLATLKTDLGLTGTNSGDQTITLTGDVTGSGTGSFATAIGAGVIVDADVNDSAAIDATKLSFTQAGAGAVARTIDSKLEDVVSVRDFGASPSASASANYTAIAAAIAAAPTGGAVYVPAGTYDVDTAIVIEKSITLFGDGPGQSVIRATHSGNVVTFQPSTAGTSSANLSRASLQNIWVTRSFSVTGTVGTAVWIRQCNYFVASRVQANQSNYCFRITGGSFNSIVGCQAYVFSGAAITKGATSANIFLEEADIGGGSYLPCYTLHITDFHGVAGELDNNIHVNNCDGVEITNCYFAYSLDASIGLSKARSASVIAGLHIANCYFDNVGAFGAIADISGPRALRVYHSFSASGVQALNITNCTIANNKRHGGHQEIVLFERYGTAVNFSNNYIANVPTPWAVRIDDAAPASSTGSYTFANNAFFNVNRWTVTGDGTTTAFPFAFSQTGLVVTINGVAQTGGGVNYSLSGTAPNSTITFNSAPANGASIVLTSEQGGAILCKNANQIAVTGNTFSSLGSSQNVIKIEGTTKHVTVTGNAFDGTASNFYVDTGATITDKLVLSRSQDLPTALANQTVAFADGTNSAPSITNSGDLDTGVYFSADNEVAVTTGGTQRLKVNSSALEVVPVATFAAGTNSAPAITRTGDLNTGIYFPTADEIAITTGGTHRLRVISDGKIAIGPSTLVPGDFIHVQSAGPVLRLEGDGFSTGVSIRKWSSDGVAGFWDSRYSRGTIASPTAVNNGDGIGSFTFRAYGGTNFRTAAQISAGVDTYTGDDDLGGKLEFYTRPAGAGGALTERLRIARTGHVQVIGAALMPWQGAPTSKSGAATLTGTELATALLEYTGSAQTITLPTGTDIQAALPWTGNNNCFDWFVVNTGSGTCTIGANSNTTVGTLTVAAGASGWFRIRRTANNTFTVYRLN